MRKHVEYVDLRMFEGAGAGASGGGAAGAGAAGAAGASSGAAGAAGGKTGGAGGIGSGTGGSASAANTGGDKGGAGAGTAGDGAAAKTPEERRADYDRLIKGEYADMYADDVQKAINRRYRENAQLHQQLESYEPIMDILSARYGVDATDMKGLKEKLEADDAFFEEGALREGMSVDTYKKYVRMQAENSRLAQAQQRSENLRQRQETIARWDREAQECAKRYPGFDIQREIRENQNFVKLLGAGVDVTSAYQACHFDDISRGLIATAEQDTKKRVADSIRAGAGRPAENAAGGSPAGTEPVDIWGMSKSEFAKFRADVLSGKRKFS